jgi:hypothetical protein
VDWLVRRALAAATVLPLRAIAKKYLRSFQSYVPELVIFELPAVSLHSLVPRTERCIKGRICLQSGPVAGLVGIEGGVVSGVINLESSGVEAPDWRPRHDKHYHEA